MIKGWQRVFGSGLLPLMAIIGLSGGLGGCSSQDDGAGAAPAAGSDGEAWPQQIVLGLIPVEGGADVAARFEPMEAHLERAMGIEVQLRPATSYNGVITAMANGQVDFAYFGPKSYVEAANRAGAEALVMELTEDGQAGYHSVIIARRDSGMETLDDARGKRFAFTDPNSASGKLIPSVHFRDKLNTRPEDFFGEIVFSGSHGTSILQVKNGDIDVAAANDLDLARNEQSGKISRDEFVILWKSDLIPASPMAARHDLPESLKEAFTEALLSFGKDDPRGLQKLQLAGYVRTNDANYDVIRRLMRLEAELAADG
jgi:phosphonate transport system substrate-binding protein